VLPYLLLCREDSPQRRHELRAVFNAVRYVARTGGQWRFLSHALPPWFVVYQQMQRWLRAGCFELLVQDVRSLLREWAGRKGQPTAVVIDSRTLQSTPESGARAGYDGPSGARDPRSILRSTRSAIFWHLSRLQTPGQRLRTAGYHTQRTSSACLRHPHAPQPSQYSPLKSITGSRRIVAGAMGDPIRYSPSRAFVCRSN
jgi:transposase